MTTLKEPFNWKKLIIDIVKIAIAALSGWFANGAIN